MNRRKVLIGSALALPTWNAARNSYAQPKNVPVIGWLHFGSKEPNAFLLSEFKDSLRGYGWRDGQNIRIEERWVGGQRDRLDGMAVELAALKPAVIVTIPTNATAAALKAAPATAVVQATGGDPVSAGLAKSLSRPGGQVTGLSNIGSDVTEKYFELLLAAVPDARRVGVLIDPANAAEGTRDAARRAVRQFPIEAIFVEATQAQELEAAVMQLTKQRAQALVVISSGLFMTERRRIVQLAIAQRWPMIAWNRLWAEEGALLSYGVDNVRNYRRAAYYVDRILNGAKPGDLPIEQPTNIDLVVNLRTAKKLGLTIPQSLLLRAEKLIE